MSQPMFRSTAILFLSCLGVTLRPPWLGPK